MMNVREATVEDATKWDEFVELNSPHSFLQLWSWAEIQAELQVPYWRFIVEDEAGFKAVALVVKRNLPLGLSWLYVPRGPVVKDKQAWISLERKLIDLAKEEKSMFMRIDPATDNKELLSKDWQKIAREVQPKNTLITDLDLPAEEILANMHSKTRYNIRLAERKGVKISFSKDIKDLDKFLQLSRDVSSRSDFHFHPPKYYEAMCKILMPAGRLEIALAQYEGKPLASHIIIKSGDTATYAHGASSSEHRNLMAPYLLQWETMKRVQSEGFKHYDWFGIAPKGAGKEHSWFGITKFKTGFGGRTVDYIGAYDLVKRPVMYKMFNSARKLLRRN